MNGHGRTPPQPHGDIGEEQTQDNRKVRQETPGLGLAGVRLRATLKEPRRQVGRLKFLRLSNR